MRLVHCNVSHYPYNDVIFTHVISVSGHMDICKKCKATSMPAMCTLHVYSVGLIGAKVISN